jgi:hypothetical protein
MKSKVPRRMHNSTPPLPVLSQINSVHASQSNFMKTNFNIILPPTHIFFQIVSFPRVSAPKAVMYLSYLSYLF